MQVAQQIYVVEEWVRNTCDEVNTEVHSCLEVEKIVGVFR